MGGANLEGANLCDAYHYILNSNFIRSSRFSATATDPWSILRRKYTGPAMLWTVLALIATCVPYVAKVLYWSAINGLQASFGAQFVCGVSECTDYTVFQLIFGFDKGIAYSLTPVTLVVYNAIRGFLTWKVAPIRDEEERSGYSPSWNGKRFWHGYRPLYRLHIVVRVLFWLAMAVFVFNAWYWLSQSVSVPAG